MTGSIVRSITIRIYIRPRVSSALKHVGMGICAEMKGEWCWSE
jgi:hypothetical protein